MSKEMSWSTFLQSCGRSRVLHVKEYTRETRHVLVVGETSTLVVATLRSQTQYEGLPDTEIPLVHEEYEMYQRKYICTHGWLQHERTSGKQTTHNLRGTGSPFQFLAQLQHRGDTCVVVLKRANYTHNHPVSKEIYMNHPGTIQSALTFGIEPWWKNVHLLPASTTTLLPIQTTE
ncbi:hypothetical protein GQ600_7613 [Phytophthora cactorum]|nr:hypothetical protein GQ600_7613 [Phytophthora cactorum]